MRGLKNISMILVFNSKRRVKSNPSTINILKIMKANHNISNNDIFDNRLSVSNHPRRVPKNKSYTGSLTGKYPIILNDGRTIIYVTDKSREDEIRLKYALKKF